MTGTGEPSSARAAARRAAGRSADEVAPDPAGLIERLATFPDLVRSAALAAPEQPATHGAWSPRGVVLHLIAVEEQVWVPRLAELAADAHPRWSWTEPRLWAGPGDNTLDGVLAIFSARRAGTVAALRALGAAAWSHRGRHAVFGDLDVGGLFRIALEHDEEHLAQITG